ncbi:MAG: hypothetical protein ABL993_05920 [Vicinamibacterales bacterium]
MSSMAAFTAQPEGNATVFEVVPADYPKFWLLVALGAVILYLGSSGVSILLVLLVTGACFVLGLNDLRPAEHKTSSRFRVTQDAIEVLGETFRESDIQELTIGGADSNDGSLLGKIGTAVARLQQTKVDAVTRSLRLRSGGRSVILAGGLDPRTASLLLAEVQGELDGGLSPTQAGGRDLGYSRSMLTAGRASVGLIGIDVRAFTGEVIRNAKNEPLVQGADDQWMNVAHESEYVAMNPGDRVSLFYGVRRGKNIHKIDGRDLSSGKVSRGGETWGSVSKIMYVVNHSSGAEGMIGHPFNRLIVPNRKLYVATGVIVVFGGVFSVFGLFSGSPEGIVFLPVCIGFFVWIRRRQHVLVTTIHEAAAKMKSRPAASSSSLLLNA